MAEILPPEVTDQFVLPCGVMCNTPEACEIHGCGKDEIEDDSYPPPCTDPRGHKFVCTGTAYGGDDERFHGEGRSLCIYCGADGDA